MHLALLTAFALSLLTGCLPVSIHPLYTADETYFDPKLPGIWTDTDGGTWQFIAAASNGESKYDQSYRSQTVRSSSISPGDSSSGLPEPALDHYLVSYNPTDGPPAEFQGWLTKVGGVTFLDITPVTAGPDGRHNMLEAVLHVPAHAWLRLEVMPDRTLQLQAVDRGRLRQQLEVDGNTALAHTFPQQDWPLITASTHELRWFIEQHLADEGFFVELSEVLNKSGGTSSAQSGAGNQYDSQYRGNTTSTKGAQRRRK